MKLVSPFILGLVAGTAITWLVAYVQPSRAATRRATQYMDRVEPEFNTAAIFALSEDDQELPQ